MDSYEQKLKWQEHPKDFETSDLRVLMALSNKRWLWRTIESLQKATGLAEDDLTSSLRSLMDRSLVRGSVSRGKREPIFGLVERVGQGRSRKSKS